jgi:hypothetical protein
MKKILILLSCFAFLIALSGNGMATIVNGGFETGDFTGWDMWVSSIYPVEFSTTTDAHSGHYAAKGSMDQSCENGSIEQTFIVPPEGIFSFYYKSNMQGGTIYDGYRILSGWSLYDITTEAQITGAHFNYTIDYTPISYDLSAYAGHWVLFRVYVGSDGSCAIPIDPPHEVHVDDVRVVTIEDILDDIEDLTDTGVLNQGQGNALIAKLEAAERMFNEGNTMAACNELQAFINQLEAYVRAGILSVEEGQSLIGAANSMISQLCG